MNIEEKIKDLNKETGNNISGDGSIDPGMQRIIEKFLKKGINTYSSCEGHFEQEIPQIMLTFEYNQELVEKLMRLKKFNIMIFQTDAIQKHLEIDYKRCVISRGYDKEYFIFTEEEFLEIKNELLSDLEEIIDSYEGDTN